MRKRLFAYVLLYIIVHNSVESVFELKRIMYEDYLCVALRCVALRIFHINEYRSIHFDRKHTFVNVLLISPSPAFVHGMQ